MTPKLSDEQIVDVAFNECYRIIADIVAAIRTKEEGTLWIKLNELTSIQTVLGKKGIDLRSLGHKSETYFVLLTELGQITKSNVVKDRSSLIDATTSILLGVYVEYGLFQGKAGQ